MLLISIGILITLYGFIDFRKGFKLFLIYRIFWLSSAQLFTVGRFSITIGLFMSGVYCILFLIKEPDFYRKTIPMPYTMPFLIICVSLFITCFTGVAGFFSEFTRAISVFLQSYSIIFIAWYVIDSEEDFFDVIRGYIWVFLVAAIYGYVEYLFQENAFLSYKAALTATGKITRYLLIHGRGYRISSIFEHPIGAGMTLGLFAVFVLYLVVNGEKRIPSKKLAIMVSVFSMPLITLTKMRSGILFTGILLLGLARYQNFKRMRTQLLGLIRDNNYKKSMILLPCILATAFIMALMWENMDLFLSFISRDAQARVGGSSASVRFGQFEAIFNIMKMSPIGGLGQKFSDYVVNSYTRAAYAYESMWFEQMAMHGMVGIAAQIILIIYSLFAIPGKYRSRECFFISLAYFVTYTLTSVPSFRLELYYFCLFWFIKNSPQYRYVSPITEGKAHVEKTH